MGGNDDGDDRADSSSRYQGIEKGIIDDTNATSHIGNNARQIPGGLRWALAGPVGGDQQYVYGSECVCHSYLCSALVHLYTRIFCEGYEGCAVLCYEQSLLLD